MAGLQDLVGRAYGPFEVPVSADRVSSFVSATRDAPTRWVDAAPPMFANAALFAAAPAFLDDPVAEPFTLSLIHSEQRFAWSRRLAVGETLQVTGTMAGVRQRGSLNLVTFELVAIADEGPWLEGTSVFVMSEEAAGEGEDAGEPSVSDRPVQADASARFDLPEEGEAIEPYVCGASRKDLVQYAAATGDWNPIHWDHEAARAAGLPGTIVHGLLMAAWMGIAAARYAPGEDPLREARIRFRNPLRPSRPARVVGSVAGRDPDGADLDLSLESGGEKLVTSRIRVTT